ncbi:MAG: amino acid ABC transporter permease [Paracoccaceae bacterium]|jgi:polar amino acid transport system permease protein|nr:amino acid ABC transporter permease [Paracoccaceae bacterium]MDG1318820.1 amino acid ABC transporter permease [Paracoccaceae bacterium]HAD27923.1 ABC transporter permease [Paracoccaceae bacterium]|tara:strand:+ start:144 stop:812 length:669 start_codon:yes stop_codon:yes gene_type:complete
MDYNWDFASVFVYWNVLAMGLWATFKLFIICSTLGLGGGLFMGMLRYSKTRWISYPAMLYVEVFRNTPVLVQIIWFFFALPVVTGIEVSPMMAAVLGITLNTIAFSAEVFRGGIQSIEREQWEAGKAIGMSYAQSMRRVILPQALKRMLPPLTSRGIEVFKMSTLASVVAYPETLQQAKLIASYEYNPIEAYTVVALMFFIVLLPLVQLTYMLERRFGKSDA